MESNMLLVSSAYFHLHSGGCCRLHPQRLPFLMRPGKDTFKAIGELCEGWWWGESQEKYVKGLLGPDSLGTFQM